MRKKFQAHTCTCGMAWAWAWARHVNGMAHTWAQHNLATELN